MPAVSLSRAGARVVESGPDGQELAEGAWRRLEALPDPRSPRGGSTRWPAWSRSRCARSRPGMTGSPRSGSGLGASASKTWPGCGPRALLGPGPRGRRRPGGPALAGVRGYRARQAARQAKTLARRRLRALAVDGKTSRGARRGDGTRVHLLGVAEHGGHLLDHVEVDVKHNETSHFTELLGPADLAGAVVTFDALHTVRANLDWLISEKQAQYIAVVKGNKPLLHAQVKGPALAARPGRQRHPRAGARPRRDPHPEGRPRQRPGLPARPPGHQDHQVAERYRHRQGLPPDRLRRHPLDQR